MAEQYAEKIAAVCRLIEAAEVPPTLHEMAERAGLSAYHFHRVFRRVTGLTPKQYAAAHRTQLVRSELGRGGSVTDAVYAAGYGSGSRFYAGGVLGMTPTAYQRGGSGETLQFALGDCSLGPILVARSEVGVCAVLLGEQLEADLRQRFPKAALIREDPQVLQSVIQLVDTGAAADLPLDIRGTVFQQRVWRALQAIPSGSTASYTEIAERIGAPKSVRAVAAACATNSLAVVIPCHRVVRKGGALAGYRWGLERKRALLDREGKP